MTTNKKVVTVAITAIVLAGALVLFTRPPGASVVFNHYVACRPPESFKMSDFWIHGLREWNAIFHFQINPGDFPQLRQCNNAELLNISNLDDVGFAPLAIQVLKHRSPTTDFVTDYECYSFSPSNAITDNYLVINKEHSDGYIVVIRY
jgi:hypothetical protein